MTKMTLLMTQVTLLMTKMTQKSIACIQKICEIGIKCPSSYVSIQKESTETKIKN